MTKKQILTAGAASIVLLAGATLAFAQTATTTTTASTTAGAVLPPAVVTAETASTSTTTGLTQKPPQPPPVIYPGPGPTRSPMLMHKDAKNTVQIGPEGNALIRGVVNAVGTNSITLSSWGGAWTIMVGADTEIMPKSTTTSLGMIKQGDFVGVNGTVDTTQAWTVNARVVRDVDAQQSMMMMQKQMRMRMKEAEDQAHEKIKELKKTGKDEMKDLRQKEQEQRQNVKDLRKQLFPKKQNTPQRGQ